MMFRPILAMANSFRQLQLIELLIMVAPDVVEARLLREHKLV